MENREIFFKLIKSDAVEDQLVAASMFDTSMLLSNACHNGRGKIRGICEEAGIPFFPTGSEVFNILFTKIYGKEPFSPRNEKE